VDPVLRPGLREVLPIFIIEKNRFTPITARHHMIKRAWILDADLSRQGPRVSKNWNLAI
jgi:hypothetical protein